MTDLNLCKRPKCLLLGLYRIGWLTPTIKYEWTFFKGMSEFRYYWHLKHWLKTYLFYFHNFCALCPGLEMVMKYHQHHTNDNKKPLGIFEFLEDSLCINSKFSEKNVFFTFFFFYQCHKSVIVLRGKKKWNKRIQMLLSPPINSLSLQWNVRALHLHFKSLSLEISKFKPIYILNKFSIRILHFDAF